MDYELQQGRALNSNLIQLKQSGECVKSGRIGPPTAISLLQELIQQISMWHKMDNPTVSMPIFKKYLRLYFNYYATLLLQRAKSDALDLTAGLTSRLNQS